MIGVEVDELALMLDGVMGEDFRFGRVSVEVLERGTSASGNRPGMMRAVAHPEWAKVAQAILELEACADWRVRESQPPFTDLSRLAIDVCEEVPWPPGFGERCDGLLSSDERFLEAAARLRDGWRPTGWRK